MFGFSVMPLPMTTRQRWRVSSLVTMQCPIKLGLDYQARDIVFLVTRSRASMQQVRCMCAEMPTSVHRHLTHIFCVSSCMHVMQTSVLF